MLGSLLYFIWREQCFDTCLKLDQNRWSKVWYNGTNSGLTLAQGT